MARCQPRRPQPGHRAQPQPDHWHCGHVGGHAPEAAGGAGAAGQVGRAGGLDDLGRAAAARAFDDAHDRQAQLGRHVLGHQRLVADRRIGRTAAHDEVVAHRHHRLAGDAAMAEHAVGWRHMLQPAVRFVLAAARQRAHLVEAARIEQFVDPIAHRQPAGVVLALDLVFAAHAFGQRGAARQFIQFRVPSHARHSISVISRATRPGSSIGSMWVLSSSCRSRP